MTASRPAIVRQRVAKAPIIYSAVNDTSLAETSSEAPRTVRSASSAIVTIRRRGRAAILPPGLLADTFEEHKRRGDAADALFRNMKRAIAEKLT